MKKICMLALIFTAICLFAGCGSGNASDTVSDTDIDAVYSEITKSVELPEMVTLDEDRLFDYMGLDPELIRRQAVGLHKVPEVSWNIPVPANVVPGNVYGNGPVESLPVPALKILTDLLPDIRVEIVDEAGFLQSFNEALRL